MLPDAEVQGLVILHNGCVTTGLYFWLGISYEVKTKCVSPLVVLCYSVLTGLAEGEVLPDAEVQKGALNILINCVCGPVERVSILLEIARFHL